MDGRRDSDGRLKGGWKAGDIEAVADYLSSPVPATVLALVGAQLEVELGALEGVRQSGQVLSFDVAKKELHGWVAEQFRQRATRAEPDAVAALIQLVGDDLPR